MDRYRAFACYRNRCSDEAVSQVSGCHGVVHTIDIHHCAIDCIWSQRHLCIEATICAELVCIQDTVAI